MAQKSKRNLKQVISQSYILLILIACSAAELNDLFRVFGLKRKK